MVKLPCVSVDAPADLPSRYRSLCSSDVPTVCLLRYQTPEHRAQLQPDDVGVGAGQRSGPGTDPSAAGPGSRRRQPAAAAPSDDGTTARPREVEDRMFRRRRVEFNFKGLCYALVKAGKVSHFRGKPATCCWRDEQDDFGTGPDETSSQDVTWSR